MHVPAFIAYSRLIARRWASGAMDLAAWSAMV